MNNAQSRTCLDCKKFQLYNVEVMVALPNESVAVTRYSCTSLRFTAVHLKSTDELRALVSQAAFCPKFKSIHA